jgi:hypothetical protein
LEVFVTVLVAETFDFDVAVTTPWQVVQVFELPSKGFLPGRYDPLGFMPGG